LQFSSKVTIDIRNRERPGIKQEFALLRRPMRKCQHADKQWKNPAFDLRVELSGALLGKQLE